jgi:hypothetical protein
VRRLTRQAALCWPFIISPNKAGQEPLCGDFAVTIDSF